MLFSRRNILHGSTLAGLVSAFPGIAYSASQGLEWVPVDQGLALVRGAGSNLLVSWGSDGVALVDGGHADYASSLLRLVNEHTGGVPELLFNSHCHRDQIGCNAALGNNGATIVAHENTRLWLSTEIITRWEDRVYPALAEKARPNKSFYYDSQTLTFNETIEYGVMPQAHTDGDIYVFFPERNVLFAGDVLSPDSYPILDYSTNGWIGGMIEGLDLMLEKADGNTRIFASTGKEVRRDRLERQREMLTSMIEQMGANYYSGGTFQEFIDADPSAAFDAQYGDPRVFLYTAYQSIWGHTGEVRRYRA